MRVQVRRFKFPYAFAYIFRFRGAQNHTVTNAKLRELSRQVYDNQHEFCQISSPTVRLRCFYSTSKI